MEFDHFLSLSSERDLAKWGREHGIKPYEAKIRFAEFLILECIAGNRSLRKGLVLKGGNGLRFAYDSPRSTKDLDFTVNTPEIIDDAENLRNIINHALKNANKRFNVKMKCQKVKRNPRGKAATHPTYQITVGYEFRFDKRFHVFEDTNSPQTVPVEISFNELVCEYIEHKLTSQSQYAISVCSLEDIIAEKLRSLLQQPIRKRFRNQDVFDIARVVRDNKRPLDLEKVAAYFIRKSEARNIEPIKSSFNATVREFAEQDYESVLRRQTNENFIPFDDAWRDVIELVQKLKLED